MTMELAEVRKECVIEIERLDPNRARIKSNWPVTSPRRQVSFLTTVLAKALEAGREVKCDAKRADFFEARIGDAWFYFHTARSLRRIYVIAALIGLTYTDGGSVRR